MDILNNRHIAPFASGQRLVEPPYSHLDQHPQARELLMRAVLTIHITDKEVKDGFIIREVDFGHVVGNTSCVRTDWGSETEYRFRLKADGTPARKGPTRFVLNRETIPTTKLVVIAGFRDGQWFLITSYIGELAPREPWDPSMTENERRSARLFWGTHALVDDGSCPLGDPVPSSEYWGKD